MYTGDSDIFKSDAAEDWLCLLEAFDQPHRPGMVRAAAATMFFGKTADDLVDGGDELTDDVAETLREWAGHARERGVAAIFEAAQLSGMGDRVLSWQGGERQMTDLAHMTQLLQEAAHREHFSLPALRDWLRAQRDEGAAAERFRRLDNDAAAVQVMTVFGAKGLQFPVVYLPFEFNRNVWDGELLVFHEGDQRCVYIGGKRRSRLQRRCPAGEGRGSQRRQPADLCRDDARAVAGGRVVGAVEGRTERRAVAAAAGTPTRVRPWCRIVSRRRRSRTTTRWRASRSGRRRAVSSSRSRWCAPMPALPADEARADLEARHFHRSDRRGVAADVVLRADSRRGDDAGEQRARGRSSWTTRSPRSR